MHHKSISSPYPMLCTIYIYISYESHMVALCDRTEVSRYSVKESAENPKRQWEKMSKEIPISSATLRSSSGM